MLSHHAFVNVGVWQGFTLLAGMLNQDKTCVGIDNWSQFQTARFEENAPAKDEFLKRFAQSKSSNHFFYEMDYEIYFQHHHPDPIGFYFYDGSHRYEDQFKG